jgi:hypothetical protein
MTNIIDSGVNNTVIDGYTGVTPGKVVKNVNPAIVSPTITGTVAGNASYTSPTVTGTLTYGGTPTVTGDITRSGISTNGTYNNITITGTTTSTSTIQGGTMNNPTITGTVAGTASYTSPTVTNPTITGTVAGTASYTSPTITGTLTYGGTPAVTGNITRSGTSSNGTYYDITISGTTTNSGIISGGTISGPTISGTVGGTATFNGITINNSSIAGTITGGATYNGITMSGGTANSITIGSSTINSPTINNGIATSITINSAAINSPSIGSATISSSTINSSTINNGSLNSATITSPTITGDINQSSGRFITNPYLHLDGTGSNNFFVNYYGGSGIFIGNGNGAGGRGLVICGGMDSNGTSALNDTQLRFRNMGDPNHWIGFDSGVDGPIYSANTGHRFTSTTQGAQLHLSDYIHALKKIRLNDGMQSPANMHLDCDGPNQVYISWFSGNGLVIANGPSNTIAMFNNSDINHYRTTHFNNNRLNLMSAGDTNHFINVGGPARAMTGFSNTSTSMRNGPCITGYLGVSFCILQPPDGLNFPEQRMKMGLDPNNVTIYGSFTGGKDDQWEFASYVNPAALRQKDGSGGTTRWELNGTGYSLPSDLRIKEEIQELTGNLNIIESVPSVSFKKKSRTKEDPILRILPDTKTEYGFIAQDIEVFMPGAISSGGIVPSLEDQVGFDIKMINQTFLLPVLWGAVRELNSKVKDLEARLAQLENNN